MVCSCEPRILTETRGSYAVSLVAYWIGQLSICGNSPSHVFVRLFRRNPTVPREVHDVLARGPKCAFERNRSAPELLSLVRQVSRLVPKAEVERGASEGADVLSRHKPANMRLPLEKTVTFLKDSGLFLLPADKEGGFVVST
ncbi:hypothetical protein HPB52_015189 [Rhipicephalus sanguineus]|uniref:Uncharacterized protein n=1 Tax=Rhipicephalus sanguineus TaxID=34632 RepID=A0A9D4TAL8_RHISA|nr:hypothetical protein HPB52_015189 [Rhipicephalus sanguineus]